MMEKYHNSGLPNPTLLLNHYLPTYLTYKKDAPFSMNGSTKEILWNSG